MKPRTRKPRARNWSAIPSEAFVCGGSSTFASFRFYPSLHCSFASRLRGAITRATADSSYCRQFGFRMPAGASFHVIIELNRLIPPARRAALLQHQ